MIINQIYLSIWEKLWENIGYVGSTRDWYVRLNPTPVFGFADITYINKPVLKARIEWIKQNIEFIELQKKHFPTLFRKETEFELEKLMFNLEDLEDQYIDAYYEL